MTELRHALEEILSEMRLVTAAMRAQTVEKRALIAELKALTDKVRGQHELTFADEPPRRVVS